MSTDISKFNPCKEAVEYRARHATFRDAWEQCPRGDWMLWIAKKAGVDKRTLTLAKALCAKTVIHLMEDPRSIRAVEVAEAYGRGNATDKELAAAAAAATAAADAYAYATDVATDVAAAAAAADAAAAAAATDAAAAAADAAADAAAYAAAAARKKPQMDAANICRKILTDAVLKLINA